MTKLVGYINVVNTLGEGPVWDDRLQRLWWTDIPARKLYRWDWDSRSPVAIDLPHRLCSFCLTSEEDCILCAFATGFALLWPENGRIEWLHEIEPKHRGIRMNDGRINQAGHFWAGSMVEDAEIAQGATGSLYSLSPSGDLTTHFSGIRISNSICFSPNDKILYFADTPTGRIECFDVAECGALSGRRLFSDAMCGGGPDGSAIDANGCLWNAEWGASQLSCYRSDGSVKKRVKLPVSRPTCPVFGGPDLDHIFVTTSRLELGEEELNREADAGKVLILKSSERGAIAPRFSLKQGQ